MLVAICTPIHRQVEADFMVSLFKTMQARMAPAIWLHTVGHSNLPKARNWLVANARAQGATDIVFIDSDIGWEPHAFRALLEAPEAAQVVAGVPQRRDDRGISFCGHPDAPKGKAMGHLLSGYAATAFMRIRTEVFDRLDGKVPEYTHEGQTQQAFFSYPVSENPVTGKMDMLLEDYAFCQFCRDDGIDVWLDPTIPLRHWHSTPLQAVMAEHVQITERAA